ncbi:NAD(P)-binding protein [Xylaria intraflava]|nr:NAD(P)-binding protein [Xylaria intraflava]
MAAKLTLGGGIALITGAAAGIGKETALSFAEAGVKGVVFADINGQGAQEAAAESKNYAKHPEYRAVAVEVDVSKENSVQNMVDVTVKEFGRIDYSVNSAGIGNISGAMTPNLNLAAFQQTVETNITGLVFCIRAVSQVMMEQEPLSYVGRHGTRSLGRGSIVNMASLNSYVAAPGMLPYTTSKHAVIGVTKSAALDCVAHHIRVNAVCPAWVDTAMMHRSFLRVPQLPQIIKTISPLKRPATVDEVADYIVFLCSPSASYINGTGLTLDAGVGLTAHA